MEVSDLILADYAELNSNGKFTLVGAGFTEILTQKLPFIHPLMFIVTRFKVNNSDTGINKITIQIVGEKGIIFKGDLNLSINKDINDVKYITLPTRLTNLMFEDRGDYCIEIKKNDLLLRDQLLKVIHKTNGLN